jgi:hypothetical protein
MVYTDGKALVADTIEELHAFAQKCGVFHFLDHRRRPHYIVQKESRATVAAHGAKYVKTSELVKKSNAMAKRREEWYKTATDDEIRERIRKFAPFQADEKVYYEGQELTQAEMFEVMFLMYKDMQEGKDVSGYKLPKVLPLTPRKDPPTAREKVANLHNLILQGKTLLEQEEAKEAPDPARLTAIKDRLEELQAEHDDLEISVQASAIAELTEQVAKAKASVDALEDTTTAEARQALTKYSNLKAQLEALQIRMDEILAKAQQKLEALVAQHSPAATQETPEQP